MYWLRLFIVFLHELHCLPNCLHICMIKIRGFYHFTKFCCSKDQVSEIVLPEAVYYKNYIFTMFIVIIVVCSLKSMCVPNFVLIGCSVSELYVIICPYRNVWPEAVYKNEVRCRDDTVPKTVDTRKHCKVGLRACNNLPQPRKTKM